MIPQEVLIPCRRFEVEVVLGPHDGLSLVEQTILRSVSAGAVTVEGVSQLLALPPRMVLEAAIDLLSRGLLDADSDGQLAASPSVLEAMKDPQAPADGWFAAFQSANVPEPASVHLAQDLVSGEIFRFPRVPRLERERLPVMPENPMVPKPDEVPSAALLVAVTRALRAMGSEADDDLHGDELRREARVLQVRVRRTSGNGAPAHVRTQREMLQATALVRDRGEEEPPRVAVVSPDWIPAQVRSRISSTLDTMWEQRVGRGPGQFFQRIRSYKSAVEVEPEAPVLPVDGLVADIERLIAEAPVDDVARHQELTTRERLVTTSLERLTAYSASASLVLGDASDFHRATLEALSSSSHQVVLACPWVTQIERSPALRDAILAAAGRGIHVVLLWGIDRTEVASDSALGPLQALEAAARDTVGAVTFASKGAGSHAKLIVCDSDWMIVSTNNFLSSSPNTRQREVGVRVQLSDGVVPLCLHEVLGWARRTLPDYFIQQRCIDGPALFGRTEARPYLPIHAPPISPPNLLFGDVGLSVWRRAWEQRARELRRMLADARSAVVPIYDRANRELLIAAVRDAQRRLLIESHRVTAQGLSEPLVELIERALARSVEVVIVHDAASSIEPVAKQRLLQLTSAGARVLPMDTHAKVLVCDDWAVVSSQNFLSVESGTRSALELGLQLFAKQLVDQLWRFFTPEQVAREAAEQP